ncbi:MAG: Bax inhibitor-1/YccA family protein [Chitinophagales bacterium]|nr:Bax inhibitor-1/YccA family protein [Chitinophagales bacterium]
MDYPNHSSSTPEHLFNSYQATGTRSKSFIANVFAYMFLALGISAVVAFLFAENRQWLEPILQNKVLFYLVVFAPLGFVLLMSFGFKKLSAPVMILLFIVYSGITGITLSFVLLTYAASSVFGCFASAAAMFGVMAFMGYTTNKDLTSFGRIMTMGLIGIVIASVINMFLGNSTMDYIISFVGVLVFTGLTAYDVQKIKRIGEGFDENGQVLEGDVKKFAIMGALTLYLDFINLFLMLLRLFGKRD